MQEYKFEQILDRGEVAMAYVPWQHLTCIYENLDEALKMGLNMTISLLKSQNREVSPESVQALAWLQKEG